jgi:hypothetical protein
MSIFTWGGSATDSEYDNVKNTPPGQQYTVPAIAVREAEIYWPPAPGTTGPGQLMAAASHRINRLYHATGVTLADGRVISLGGSDRGLTDPAIFVPQSLWSNPRSEDSAEVYSPPYKFKGVSGVLSINFGGTAHSRAYNYGENLILDLRVQGTSESMADPSNLPAVVLLRAGSSTHGFDADQRLVQLRTTNVEQSGPYKITAALPTDGYLAPPGWYVAYVVTPTTKVPIGGDWIRIH